MIYSTFFSKNFTFPLFYWHFKNMLYNIFSHKPPISPPKTPSKPYLFSPLSASFVAKKSKIHAFFADNGKFYQKSTLVRYLSGYLSGCCKFGCTFHSSVGQICNNGTNREHILQFSISHIIFQIHQLIIIIFICLIYSIKFSTIIKIFINCINYTFHLFT